MNAILESPVIVQAIAARGRVMVLRATRGVLDDARSALLAGEPCAVDVEALATRAVQALDAQRSSLRPVINASGILLHTGLGRAPLAAEAADAIDRIVRGYCNLEIDLETGSRGQRTAGVADLLRLVTGAESATVVNNNAAATVLALRALAAGREVIVSRGQLVEIGGSFRLPEIFQVSGARLHEVGTTNKTRLGDYERAINLDTAALLRVHASNYRIVGFTEQVSIADLAGLARSRGLWTIDDIGSGALGPARPPLVADEPTVQEALAARADLVLCSGDKLLGGPQCGILLGTRAAIDLVKRDPLMRALRVDKMTLAALEATLHLAADAEHGRRKIPLWAFLTTPIEVLEARAERLADACRRELGLDAAVVRAIAMLGGGSVPIDPIPTMAVRLSASFASETALATALRLGEPPILPRVHDGAVLLDLRAVTEPDDAVILNSLHQIAAGFAGRERE
jgi:L-seryl-tRNA(Ser) seleniumtransferase